MTVEALERIDTGAALRHWIEEHDMTVTGFAAAVGLSRVAVHRWLADDRPRPKALSLILTSVEEGLVAAEVSRDSLQRWMDREAFDGTLLSEVIGVHRTTVGRWLGNLEPTNPIPSWLALVLPRLSGDIPARRARRRRLAEKVAVAG